MRVSAYLHSRQTKLKVSVPTMANANNITRNQDTHKFYKAQLSVTMISGSLSPRRGASSGCGWSNGLGIPRRRWEESIKMDLQEVGFGGMDWIELAQDRTRCRVLVTAVMNFRVP